MPAPPRIVRCGRAGAPSTDVKRIASFLEPEWECPADMGGKGYALGTELSSEGERRSRSQGA